MGNDVDSDVDSADKEKLIREAMAESLGIEFYAPNELESELVKSGQLIRKLQSQRIVSVSVSEIIRRLADAYNHMGDGNSHKSTMKLAANTIHQLATNLDNANRRIAELDPAPSISVGSTMSAQ